MKTFVPTLVLSILLALTTTASMAAPTDKASTEAQLESINSDVLQLKKLLDKLNKERSSAEKQLQSSEKEISNTQSDIRSIEKRLKEGQSELKKLKSRQQTLTAKKNKEQDRIAASVQSAYLASRDNRLKLLLNQEDPDEISRQLTYLKYLQKAQIDAIRAFEAVIEELQTNAEDQQQINDKLSLQKVELVAKQKLLRSRQQNRQKLITRINKRYNSNDQELDSLHQQKKQLEGILATLALRAKASKPLKQLRGRLQWPVKGSVKYKYNQKRPDTPIRWPGLFINTESGSKVTAIHDGTIIFSDWLRGYGQLIIVDHGSGYLSLYGHNQWLLKQEGESVLAGEELALSGQSGGQSNPGVYLEIRHKGKPQNPTSWLSKR